MIRHIGIVVKDLTKSMEFYHKLGFTLFHSARKEDSDFIDKISAGKNILLYTTRVVNVHGDMIEFLEYNKHTITGQQTLFNTGLAHFALTVENIHDLDISWISPPTVNPEKTVKIATIDRVKPSIDNSSFSNHLLFFIVMYCLNL